MQNAQKTHRFLTALTAAFAAAGFAAAVMAAGLHANVDADIDVRTDARTDAKVVTPGNAEAGAAAESHMSPSGQSKSNAQWRDDATRGTDRASERLEREGLDADVGASGEADAGASSGTR